MPVQIQAGRGAEAEGGFRLGQNGENPSVLNRQRMMFENQTFRLDGNDPAGIEQGSDGCGMAINLRVACRWIIAAPFVCWRKKTPRRTGAQKYAVKLSALLADHLFLGGHGDNHAAIQRATRRVILAIGQGVGATGLDSPSLRVLMIDLGTPLAAK
jgi:hypothetical protein